MKRMVFFILIASLAAAPACFGMVGGPLFTIGKQITSMTVEASQVEMKVPMSATGDLRGTMMSQRLFLAGRYGLENSVDIEFKLGAADLNYNKLGGGYTDYASSPALAWGAGLRAGFPSGTPYQVTGSLSYVGYHADATTRNGSKSINSKYFWQEIVPTATFGYRLGNLLPYLGLQKPYLFGTREYKVTFNGQEIPSAGGDGSYSDGKQSIRGLIGLEWRMPDGYSIAGEVSATSDRTWTLAIGLAQALK